MAAVLPISAAKAAPRPAVTAQPFGANAPSSTLPLVFTVTGLIALFAGAAWMVARPDILAAYHYNPATIAVTHLFVLGWICSVVMGAMYQLVPVALETKLYSERLAGVQFIFHAIGFAGMVWGFTFWQPQLVAIYGSVVVAGVILFIYNLGRTLLRIPEWNVVAASIVSALGWVLFAVTAGLLIAIAKSYSTAWPRVANLVFRFDPISTAHAHAHLGVVGFFTMLIVGVSYKLVPMFTLSELQNRRRAAWAIILLNIGLVGGFLTMVYHNSWKPIFSLVITAALVLYLWEIRSILQARKRQTMDWGIRYFLTAIGLLLPLAVIGIVLSWPGLPMNSFTMQLENVYGFLGLMGVVSFAIMGMLYKIIPFLVWFGVYSKHIGRAKVPALADMYSARRQVWGYWFFLSGLTITLVGVEFASTAGVRGGCILLAASLLFFGVNVASMLRHFVRPQLQPLMKTPVSRASL